MRVRRYRGTVINDGSNEQLVEGQESFSVAALGGMGQNLDVITIKKKTL